MQRSSKSNPRHASLGLREVFSACLRNGPAITFLALLSVTGVNAQQPRQYSPEGFVRPGQPSERDPAEAAAYSAAVNEPNLNVRMSAIQQFLINYPTSTLRQPAIAQMMMAQRQTRGIGSPPGMMNRPVPVQQSLTQTPAPVSTPAPAQPMQTNGAQRDSLLQQLPKPAEITFAPNSLSIKADNATLSQILHDISITTGMKIEGLSKDERIFGTYGPGEAREVLLALLQGSGYNVVMVGGIAGAAPKQLSLSQRGASATPTSASVNTTTASAEDDSSDDSDQDVQQVPPPEPPQVQQLPGNQPGAMNDGNQQPRSPQEILQELQRLRQETQPGQPPQ